MVAGKESEKTPKKRWTVTYTKHIKQKRKVYQDGVLELCSSSGKPQVILYDDCEKLIDRRFLKKDEVVELGGTLSFETHIVDIGDLDRSYRPSAESNVKSVVQPTPPNEKLYGEWNVLYTAHMTQKAKKYHDGFMRVLICSSHLNLITLLNEGGDLLSSKYLKSIASVETGKNFEFPNYLVEICERRTSATVESIIPDSVDTKGICNLLHTKDSMKQVASSIPEKCYKLTTSRRVCKIPLHNAQKKEASGCGTSGAGASAAFSDPPKDHSKKVANTGNSEFGSFINSSAATLRDAQQIFCALKKPSSEGRLIICDPFVKQGVSSQSSDRCHIDLLSAKLVVDTDCKGYSSENGGSSSIWSSDAIACGKSKLSIGNARGGYTGLTTEVSLEVVSDHMSLESGQTNTSGMDAGISKDSTPEQHFAKASQTIEIYEPVSFEIAASTGHGTLDSLVQNSAEDFPTFDLGL